MKAIFFDRDGVINNNAINYYTINYKQWVFNPGIIETLKYLYKLKYSLFLVTNQGGISKGCCTKEQVEELHNKVFEELKRNEIEFTDVMICPHHSDFENCLCRKPKSLMLEKLIAKYNIDVSKSWFIGDSNTDLEAAEKAGIKHIIIVEPNSNIESIIRSERFAIGLYM